MGGNGLARLGALQEALNLGPAIHTLKLDARKMLGMIWNPRGSMWHRWDPHRHAPGTLLNDQFHGNWDEYLTDIENSNPVICALGVTDYFSIGTYRAVKERKAAGRLKDVELIFPNVEMRLEVKTASEHGINIHLLFSPDDPHHENEIERILGKLRFWYKDRHYACNRTELIHLGRAFDPKQTDENGAHRKGANLFKVGFSDLLQVFRDERKWLSQNCLVAIPARSGDGTSGLQDDSSFAALREEIERFAHIIFSSNERDRDFWLGRSSVASRDVIEATYRTLKPCLNGSDAHKVGSGESNRFCWIKGDLTFETLWQVVFSPESRVVIGSEAPLGASASEVIRKVTLHNAPFVAVREIPINPGLVTIIGARGSGKTALMEFMAVGATSLPTGKNSSSFIQRADDLLGDAKVQLTWGDGERASEPLHDPFFGYDDEPGMPSVCYLSQQFVERLCSSSGLAKELREEMERVVFESKDQSEKMQCESFSELSGLLLGPPADARSELEGSIRNIGELIQDEDQLNEGLPALEKVVGEQTEQIGKLKKEMAEILPQDKEAHIKRLADLEAAFNACESRIEGLRLRQKRLRDLLGDVLQTIETREPDRFGELKRKFAGTALSDAQWESFRMDFKGDVQDIIIEASKALDSSIKTATEGKDGKFPDPENTPLIALPLNQLRELRDASKSTVGIDSQKQRKYDELQRTITQVSNALRKAEADRDHAKGAPERRKVLMQRRRSEYVKVFATFADEEKLLDDLYSTLRTRLETSAGALGKLAFEVKRDIGLDEWVKAGEKLLDLRRESAFRGHGQLRECVIAELLNSWATGSPERVDDAMDAFRAKHQGDFKNAMPEFDTQAQRRKRGSEIATWLYSTDHIKVQYGISYDGVPIERLSPGTRGIVLLLLYLAVDTKDRRPLFIDQPEENLDPRSVFTELVPHFRDAKSRRQVVMVTHNANLVVNTDADQVIIANAETNQSGGLPTIGYASGSIEDPKIRKAICKLLEGGRRAFLDREKRYRIVPGDDDGDS